MCLHEARCPIFSRHGYVCNGWLKLLGLVVAAVFFCPWQDIKLTGEMYSKECYSGRLWLADAGVIHTMGFGNSSFGNVDHSLWLFRFVICAPRLNQHWLIDIANMVWHSVEHSFLIHRRCFQDCRKSLISIWWAEKPNNTIGRFSDVK